MGEGVGEEIKRIYEKGCVRELRDVWEGEERRSLLIGV